MKLQIGLVQTAEVEVSNHFGLNGLNEIVLCIKVILQQSCHIAVKRLECLVEGRLVKVDGDFVDVVHASNHIVDSSSVQKSL